MAGFKPESSLLKSTPIEHYQSAMDTFIYKINNVIFNNTIFNYTIGFIIITVNR